MKIGIAAKSSSDVPYTVDFVIEEDKLSVKCNCKAGIHRQICKHKTELLAGDTSRLFDPADTARLSDLQALIDKAPGIKSITDQIAVSERIIKEEQAKVKKIKKQFAKSLYDGIGMVDS